jgi:hypothetical protein
MDSLIPLTSRLPTMQFANLVGPSHANLVSITKEFFGIDLKILDKVAESPISILRP